MLTFIISALITFGLMQANKYMATLTPFGILLLIALMSGLIFLSCNINSNRSNWVFLCKKDGSPLGQGWLAVVSVAASISILLLLSLAAVNWLVTFAFFFIVICGLETVTSKVKDSYEKAREKRQEKIENIRNAAKADSGVPQG